ncbi:MAG: YihY/virulence factor BrkB family protein [Solirubrobacterales bacterium]|jgi:membrane protein|nr:YihY/virulence factor BrkB family protein [Solirubrobacterales bacterium]
MAELVKQGHARKTTLGATLKRTLSEFKEDNLSDWAAALTYYGVLSIFPALIAMVSIVGLVADPKTVTTTLTDLLSSVAPGGAADTFKGPIEEVTKSKGQSGILLIVGILGALSSASSYVGAFMRASNVMYEVDEGRPFWKLRPLQMLVTFFMVMLLAISAVAVVASGPLAKSIGDSVGLGDTAVTIYGIAKWPILVVVVAFMISVLYYTAPNAKLPSYKFITVGGAVAVLVWLVASLLFAFYVANFGSYNKTYGALGGVIGALVWLWITNQAILLGAQLNAERERDRQIEEGTPGAEKDLKMVERDKPKDKQKSKTA